MNEIAVIKFYNDICKICLEDIDVEIITACLTSDGEDLNYYYFVAKNDVTLGMLNSDVAFSITEVIKFFINLLMKII